MEICYDGNLVMPSNYVVVNVDEMEYVDGGVIYTSAECKQIVTGLGLASGQVLIAMATTAAIVSKVIKWAKGVGGPIAWILGAAGSLVASAIGKIAWGIGYGAISGKNIEICACMKPWEAFVSVDWE